MSEEMTREEVSTAVEMRPIRDAEGGELVEVMALGHDIDQEAFEEAARVQFGAEVGEVSREWAHYVPADFGRSLVTSTERRRGAQAVTIAAVREVRRG